jgi:hypothetical protein
MEPDLYNLSGLNEPNTENLNENNKEVSMTDLLDQLYSDIKSLLNNQETSSSGAEVAWFCGEKIRKVLGFVSSTPKAAEAFDELAKHLQEITNNKLTKEKILNYVRFAETFPDIQIISRLSDELSLEHFLLISELDDDLHRIFYSEKCFAEKWSISALNKAITNNLFEKDYS